MPRRRPGDRARRHQLHDTDAFDNAFDNAWDAPRETTRPAAMAPTAAGAHQRLRMRRKIRLLTLAADLHEIGVACRLVEYGAVLLLRCWNPHQILTATPTVVACTLEPASGCLLYRYHPDGDVLADASAALQPGEATSTALTIAATLGLR